MKGKGIFYWPDGKRYEGEFNDDKKNGYGEFYWPDGRVFKGMWKNGVQDGEGEIYDPKKDKTKKGLWENGKKIKWPD